MTTNPMLLLGLVLLFATAGALLAEKRGRSRFDGFLFGLVLGPLGLAILALKRPLTAESGHGSSAGKDYAGR